jgi:hypothetical protein
VPLSGSHYAQSPSKDPEDLSSTLARQRNLELAVYTAMCMWSRYCNMSTQSSPVVQLKGVGDAVTGCPDPSSCSPRFCARPESCDTRSKQLHRSGHQTTLPVTGPSRDCDGVVIWPPRVLGSHRYLCAWSHQMWLAYCSR